MRAKLRPYIIFCIACIFCAIATVVIVWNILPQALLPWMGIFSFAVIVTLAELLAVDVNEGYGVSVTPTSPILWTATCVLGPLSAIVSSVLSGILTAILRSSCFHISKKYFGIVDGELDFSSKSNLENKNKYGWILNTCAHIGRHWQTRPFWITMMYLGSYTSGLVMNVGPAGLVYYWLGGSFLAYANESINGLRQFVLPFLGLVVTSLLLEDGLYIATMTIVDPIPGGKGIYSVILRMKLAWLQTALPIGRAQVFLIVVGLLLSYLYMHIGFIGFILAGMPILALRDFFNQWMQEKSAYVDTITALAIYMQHYHPYTRGHLRRVADLSEKLARELRLSAESVRHMSTAGFLHDIGKIGVSEDILDKPDKLTSEEWEIIKEHPVKGAEIISHLEFLEGIVDWIKYHHKWHNGEGYPPKNGDDNKIPIEAEIISVVDSFDAIKDRELSIEWKCD